MPVQFAACCEPIDLWTAVAAYPTDNAIVVFLRDVTSTKLAQAEVRARDEVVR